MTKARPVVVTQQIVTLKSLGTIVLMTKNLRRPLLRHQHQHRHQPVLVVINHFCASGQGELMKHRMDKTNLMFRALIQKTKVVQSKKHGLMERE